MTDPYREQRPLLCDDYSDEEFDVKNYNYQRRNPPLVRSGRARNYAKGAAAVITRWPDNCSTSVAYWWLGISMIAITVLVIYNSVLIFGMIPASDMTLPKYRIFNNEIKVQALAKTEVYMHLFINNSTDILLKKYLPYTTIISKKYPSFKYKFLIVLNDTLKEFHDYKDEERNEIAFNSLWINEKVNKKVYSKYNISVEYISLTAYLNDSPIKKFWRHLPSHLLEFLVRSVSIWEKGGIAFNPNILVPNLYNSHYVQKLYDIFNTYSNSSSKPIKKVKTKSDIKSRRPNNIRDIINESGKDDNNISNVDLSEAENNDVSVLLNTGNTFKFKRNLKANNKLYDGGISFENKKHNNNNSSNSTNVPDSILPLFLKYLFDNQPKKHLSDLMHLNMSRNNNSVNDISLSFNQDQSLPVENILKLAVKRNDRNNSTTNLKELNTQIFTENSPDLKLNIYDNIPELSIDIKGNIIASKLACHAFLGTMFSNVFQHTEEETLTDFILSELSLFCNELITSCPGVNVILV